MIRVNSQSGKGGVAYILKAEHKLDLPRRAQIEFSRVIQQHTDAEGGEMTPEQIWTVFRAEYLDRETPLRLNSVHTSAAAGEKDQLSVNVYVDGELQTLTGEGNGPIAAFVDALNELPQDYDVRVLDYAEHALSAGGDAIAAAYVECLVGDQVLWGVGLDANIVTASLKAVISAVNRVVHGGWLRRVRQRPSRNPVSTGAVSSPGFVTALRDLLNQRAAVDHHQLDPLLRTGTQGLELAGGDEAVALVERAGAGVVDVDVQRRRLALRRPLGRRERRAGLGRDPGRGARGRSTCPRPGARRRRGRRRPSPRAARRPRRPRPVGPSGAASPSRRRPARAPASNRTRRGSRPGRAGGRRAAPPSRRASGAAARRHPPCSSRMHAVPTSSKPTWR